MKVMRKSAATRRGASKRTPGQRVTNQQLNMKVNGILADLERTKQKLEEAIRTIDSLRQSHPDNERPRLARELTLKFQNESDPAKADAIWKDLERVVFGVAFKD
jgi:hypothetical protein